MGLSRCLKSFREEEVMNAIGAEFCIFWLHNLSSICSSSFLSSLKAISTLKFYVFFLLLIISTIFLSCEEPPLKINHGFKREEMLFRYLKDVQRISVDSAMTIVLVNSTNCGACSKDDLEEIQKKALFDNQVKRRIAIFSKPSPILESVLQQIPRIEFVYDESVQLERYSLKFNSRKSS